MRLVATFGLCAVAWGALALGLAKGKKHDEALTVTGKVSVYGGGATASGNAGGASAPGFAYRSHSTFGRRFCVSIDGGRLRGVLKHIDYGPASWTGRALDITFAGVAKLKGHGGFVTDQIGKARLLSRKPGPGRRCGPKERK